MGNFILFILSQLLSLLMLAIVLKVVISMLVSFDIIHLRNPWASQFVRFLDAVTYPILRPLQRIVPLFAGIDITPLLALILLEAIQGFLLPWLFRPLIVMLGG
jgi:YggT family protein